MDLFGHMISLMVMNELNTAHTLSAALKTTGDIVKHRDPTTGTHIDRMSRYAELIARALADRYDLNDEYIQYVYLFSPLHDIGKVGIPDSILLKTGQLTEEEYRAMQRHTVLGRELIDRLLDNFGLDGFRYADVLRNIAEYHHEAVNGSGYPDGLAGDDIPLEARIVAVADVFDALTSQRPYKPAWSNGKALKVLQQMADTQLDHDCVSALIHHRDEIERIQREFGENTNL
jgi:HD-GYP domain-containing protein (c-di-GMP phosphodiesterase class II)